MRIVYMGSPAESVGPLKYLLEHAAHELVGVVSQPARPFGRGRQLKDPPLAEFAKLKNLNLLQPEKASHSEFLETLERLNVDVIVTCAYGQILSQKFLDIPKRATINIHPSMLPLYRGATPVQSALLDGLDSTGVSILFTVKALDAGNIILQKPFSIETSENASTLLERLFVASGPLLAEAMEKLEDKDFKGVPQDESKVTHCTKIKKEDGLIDWTMPANLIRNRFRAFSPWPGMFSYLEGKRLQILDFTVSDTSSTTCAGSLHFDKSQKVLCVATGTKEVFIKEIKKEGGKKVDASAFWNGLKAKDGHVMGKQEK